MSLGTVSLPLLNLSRDENSYISLGKPVRVFENPFREVFSDVHLKPPLMQLQTTSSLRVTWEHDTQVQVPPTSGSQHHGPAEVL